MMRSSSSLLMKLPQRLVATSSHNVVRSFSHVHPPVYNANIDFTKLDIEVSCGLKARTPNEELVFGKTFTDHMLEVDWDADRGWHAPRIIPFQNISLNPAATCLHYAIECFEGMKAYKDSKGEIRMFRPDMNMKRLNNSMTRLAMPPINGSDGFLECVKELIRLDESWVPDQEGYSLYIRPTAIGTAEVLGVHASEKVKLFCILSPVGPYYKSGFKPVKLFADSKNVRAWPGGVGNAKVGGNYAPTIYPSQLAAKNHGCSQILWLYGEDHQVTEVGAMNIFFLFKKPNGKMELVTPPLTRGDILPGVTRDSVLEIARGMGDVEVNERFLTMREIITHQQNGTLLESFGAGTAAVISPVSAILYEGNPINIPTGDEAGPFAQKMWRNLMDIQYGRIEHPWSVKI